MQARNVLAAIMREDWKTPRWGARALLWGVAGMGKDALAAHVVHPPVVSGTSNQPPDYHIHSSIRDCAEFELQVWLQGSNSELFERQLRRVGLARSMASCLVLRLSPLLTLCRPCP